MSRLDVLTVLEGGSSSTSRRAPGRDERDAEREQRGPRVAEVVPANNESLLIARTLRSIPAFVYYVVVVDDVSLDDMVGAALAVGDRRVEVLRLPHNGGVGRAIAMGYRHAFQQGADACAVMAGDAQMDPADLARVLAPVLRKEADYVKGDRLSYPGARRHMPLTRWLGNVGLSLLTRLVTGLTIRDSQCGYTALSRRAAEQLPLEQLWPRYGYPNDLLGLLGERQLRVRDVMVRPIYADEQSGVGLRHALFVVPYVLLRVLVRRVRGAFGAQPLEQGTWSEAESSLES
jgi:glycosyltransferase involved in cell wall biosynthesis